MPTKTLYILKLGTTFSDTVKRLGDFEHWIINAMDSPNGCIAVIDLVHDDPLPDIRTCGGIIITGSHAMVTDNHLWSVKLEQWLPDLILANVPILGICYGHQILARALGGTVDYHPLGEEAGTVTLQLTPAAETDLLFRDLPTTFSAHASHSQTVTTLPIDAVLLAFNAHESHHAFRFGKLAWGVQFHPEYTPAVMHAYLDAQMPTLVAQGHDADQLRAAVSHTPHAKTVLQRFACLCDEVY